MGGGMTEPEEYIASLKEKIQELMLQVATLEEKLKMSESLRDVYKGKRNLQRHVT